ncbi:MAG TPA: thiamine pyrophosphate-dependent enzyme [Saprospiraceae bacterium]|nr:thiamine pyrophosphate-dependent enzyme [Saprospiraceae bacterium]
MVSLAVPFQQQFFHFAMLDFKEIEALILPENEESDRFRNEVIRDYWISCISREASILARKDVLLGKAKFGITGDGKEVPQVALARAMRAGDWRSGYYRDQTLMFALGITNIEDYFAQLYSDTNFDPFSGGRQMNNHYATRMVDRSGEWIDQRAGYNISSDVSCTGGQMARALGLAMASKMYRDDPDADALFSNEGNEVCICTIGDASTTEGIFWETVNAAGVMQIPLAVFIWDDGYGISVPTSLQTTKGDLTELLSGFITKDDQKGIEVYTVPGWDYPTLVEVFERALNRMRKHHIPMVFHITEVTQPQGHSTSGSHERYKSQDRLLWERNHDCIKVMGNWMVDNQIATEDQLQQLRKKAKEYVRHGRNAALHRFYDPAKKEIAKLTQIYEVIKTKHLPQVLDQAIQELKGLQDPLISDIVRNAKHIYYTIAHLDLPGKMELHDWIVEQQKQRHIKYHQHLYNETPKSALQVPVVYPTYSADPEMLNGYQILNRFFDHALQSNTKLIAFGEDVGKIGGVNQTMAGMQDKHGVHRVFDTGIREWTIVGQAVGLSMRGWRPLAEIQYLDYLVYALPELTDDLASLHYRSNGIQIAPTIIRTRGHRLEGIWHAGSPLGMLIHALRGIHIVVPRNMTQASGFYNTLLQSHDPALVIECLNGYRLKEPLPDNLAEIKLPLGVPEVLHEGSDVTLVTYGSCVRVALAAVPYLEKLGIRVEIIDVQTLLPFDLEHVIVNSLKKTNRVVFMDEDVPGGATAYMMQKVLEEQKGYNYLDSPPATITAKEHRTPYGSDGDYYTKPNAEDVVEKLYDIMQESYPNDYPRPV